MIVRAFAPGLFAGTALWLRSCAILVSFVREFCAACAYTVGA
jgi:hypothetical protein